MCVLFSLEKWCISTYPYDLCVRCARNYKEVATLTCSVTWSPKLRSDGEFPDDKWRVLKGSELQVAFVTCQHERKEDEERCPYFQHWRRRRRECFQPDPALGAAVAATVYGWVLPSSLAAATMHCVHATILKDSPYMCSVSWGEATLILVEKDAVP